MSNKKDKKKVVPTKPAKVTEAVENTERANTVVLKNRDLNALVIWLDIPLHSEQARARNRIVSLLKDEFAHFESDRLELLKGYQVMKDGKPVIEKGDDGKDHFKLKDGAKFETEWQKLRNTDVIFDVLPSNREYWRIVRALIENTKNDMDFETTEWWEGVLSALAKV